MKSTFIDSAFVIALESKDDQNHLAAIEYWQELVQSPSSLITTSFVLDEIATYFNSRNRHKKAVEIVESFLNSKAVELVHVDETLFQTGWKYFVKHADKRYSLTDCISFVIMKERHIEQALTFDKHFKQAGFKKL